MGGGALRRVHSAGQGWPRWWWGQPHHALLRLTPAALVRRLPQVLPSGLMLGMM